MRAAALDQNAVFVAFDFETTGLSPGADHITQVGAVKLARGATKPLGRLMLLVNPGQHIPQADDPDPRHPGEKLGEHAPGFISDTSDTDVQYASSEADAVKQFKTFASPYPLVGHNIIAFDMKFLDAVDPAYARRPLVFDTLPIARAIHPGLPSYKLVDLVRVYNLQGSHLAPHQASSDTEATGQLFLALIDEAERMPAERLAALRAAHADRSDRLYAFLHQVVQGNGVEAPVAKAMVAKPVRSGGRRVAVAAKGHPIVARPVKAAPSIELAA